MCDFILSFITNEKKLLKMSNSAFKIFNKYNNDELQNCHLLVL